MLNTFILQNFFEQTSIEDEGWKILATCRYWRGLYLNLFQANENVKLGHCYSIIKNMEIQGDFIVTGIAYSGRVILMTNATVIDHCYNILVPGQWLTKPKFKYYVAPIDEENSYFISILSEATSVFPTTIKNFIKIEQAVSEIKNYGYWNKEGRFFLQRDVSCLTNNKDIVKLYKDLMRAKPGDMFMGFHDRKSGLYEIKKGDYIVLRIPTYDVLKVAKTSDVGFTACLLDNRDQFYCFSDQTIDAVFQDEALALLHSTKKKTELSENIKNLRPGDLIWRKNEQAIQQVYCMSQEHIFATYSYIEVPLSEISKVINLDDKVSLIKKKFEIRLGDEINIFDQRDGRLLDCQIVDRIVDGGLVLNGRFFLVDLIDIRGIIKRGTCVHITPQIKKRKS